jgi:flagellar L-ring protein precursor FlgH
MRIRSSIAALGILCFAAVGMAQPLWDSDAGGSLFTNTKAHGVGDILRVVISENSSASSDTKTKTEGSSEVGGSAGAGFLDFIPLWGVTQESKYDGKGQTSRRGKLNAVMSVRIVEELPGDQFRIEGMREVKRNGETDKMNLMGIIRKRDISPQNTILSSAIAEAKISYEGTGDVSDGHRPGFIMRFVNWIF